MQRGLSSSVVTIIVRTTVGEGSFLAVARVVSRLDGDLEVKYNTWELQETEGIAKSLRVPVCIKTRMATKCPKPSQRSRTCTETYYLPASILRIE